MSLFTDSISEGFFYRQDTHAMFVLAISCNSWGHMYLYWLALIAPWISNYMRLIVTRDYHLFIHKHRRHSRWNLEMDSNYITHSTVKYNIIRGYGYYTFHTNNVSCTSANKLITNILMMRYFSRSLKHSFFQIYLLLSQEYFNSI